MRDGAGQLDAEIAASAWLTVSIEAELLFDTPADRMWESAIRKLGANPGTLQTGQGVHYAASKFVNLQSSLRVRPPYVNTYPDRNRVCRERHGSPREFDAG